MTPFTSRLLGLKLIGFLCLVFLVSCSDSPTSPDDDDNGLPEWTEEDHRQNPGDWANRLLSDEEFSLVRIQVQYMEGFMPRANSLARMVDFMEERMHKPGGIQLEVDSGSIPSGGQESYSAADVRQIEQEYRTVYSEGDELAIYVLFLDGYFQQENVLGIAYYNTSTALFQKKIQEVSGSGLTQPSRESVETTVLKHEIGHLLGLVDNGSPMQNDHLDEGRGAHCENENCLMYYTVSSSGFVDNLIGNNVPSLDDNCILDLQANGGK